MATRVMNRNDIMQVIEMAPTIRAVESVYTMKSQGEADMLLGKLDERKRNGLATPKQIKQLEMRGFQNVGTWSFDQARRLIDRIAANGWKTPRDLNPREYRPPADTPKASGY